MTTTKKISSECAMTQLWGLAGGMPAGRGTVLGPHMLALVDWVDLRVVEFALKAGASELPVPRLIAHSVLERAGYFESFPASIVEESEGGCMPPATCYHCYAKLAATSLREPVLLTCIARCRRNESEEESGRLQTFTMREIVFIGSAGWVRKQRQEWTDRILAFAQTLHLVVQLDAATDSFFAGGEARGRKVLHQIKSLKITLRGQMAAKEMPWAIFSFKFHETFIWLT